MHNDAISTLACARLDHVPRATTFAPRCTMNVRVATLDGAADLAFIDALQKMHSHMVGFFPRKQIEKRIGDGEVLIAEELAMTGNASIPVGYIMAKDQYMKRDDVGIVYQLNVLPLRQRHLVGATLVKSAFERAAYGCRLFSCWCAQDIAANWFWESIGFVPLAFRTGSRAKQRIHIFWQRRVRDNDDAGGAPYWFPSKTEGGSVGEDRIVLPIVPGTHWRDVKPLVLPGLPAPQPQAELPQMLPGGQPVRARPEQPKITAAQRAAIMRANSKALGGVPLGKKAVIRGGRIKYVDIPGFDAATDAAEELAPPIKAAKPRRAAPRMKHDPEYLAAAREMRDRYLEEVNGNRLLPGATGKYDVSRQLEAAPTNLKSVPLLDAA